MFSKMVKLPNWLPVSAATSTLESSICGKIMSDTSVLGRFFRLSMLADDDPRVVDAYFSMASGGVQMSAEILNLIGKQIHPLQASARVQQQLQTFSNTFIITLLI